MDNKEIDGKQLYCRPAQTKAEREEDIKHES